MAKIRSPHLLYVGRCGLGLVSVREEDPDHLVPRSMVNMLSLRMLRVSPGGIMVALERVGPPGFSRRVGKEEEGRCPDTWS